MNGEEEGDRLWAAAMGKEEVGDEAGAISLYRQAVDMGCYDALLNLGNLLTDEESTRQEGRRCYYRAVRLGSSSAAWNLAMDHRMAGNRRRYWHWVQVAARLGHEDAHNVLRMAQIIRSQGRKPPMFFLEEVEDDSVDGVLAKFLDSGITALELRRWATLVMRGEAALRPCRSRRAIDVLHELSGSDAPLTLRRARELRFKLA